LNVDRPLYLVLGCVLARWLEQSEALSGAKSRNFCLFQLIVLLLSHLICCG